MAAYTFQASPSLSRKHAIESAIAPEKLDTGHEPTRVAPGDKNTYILGSIRQQNVVMACINDVGSRFFVPSHVRISDPCF